MKKLVLTIALLTLLASTNGHAQDSNGIYGTTDKLNNYNRQYNDTRPSYEPPVYNPQPVPVQVYNPPARDYSSPIDNGRRDASGSGGGLYKNPFLGDLNP